ncbi:MAG: DUF2971 domain-containing protein [Faecalibacterium sp.]|nr:DUF2971 domain-containing protein [Ruminococcus sp.]MCM1391400.1 DUF2971 domain-containing protein [Ruminococcus sp.]MCM1484610.1 DUF2971 domain-containing protein [Faecalibacterium sp.]
MTVPKRLFRYCSLNEYSLSNLVNNQITLSSPMLFNDIYDCTIHRSSLPYLKKDLMELNEMSVNMGHKTIKMNTEYIESDFAKRDRFYMTYMTEPMRIGCFSEDEKSILMWSHYADMNRGICIEYDFFNSPNVSSMIYPVIYLDNPLDMSETCKKSDAVELERSVLLSSIVKNKVWSYEKEWRYIFYMITYKPLPDRIPIINIPIPKKIYLGTKFINYWLKNGADSIFDDFCDYVKQHDIPIEVMYNEILSFKLSSKTIDVELLKRLDESELYNDYLI